MVYQSNSRELKNQIFDEFGKIPKKLKLYNCVGGGSSSFGFWNEFMDYKKQVEFIGVEAGGPSKSKKHAAPLTYGSKIGILHGAAQYVNQNSEGQIEETELFQQDQIIPSICHSLFLKILNVQDILQQVMKTHSGRLQLCLSMKKLDLHLNQVMLLLLQFQSPKNFLKILLSSLTVAVMHIRIVKF